MNYFNPLLLSHNFCFLSQAHQDNTILYLRFIPSKQSPNRSISSYSIISMYFLPSSSVCVWSSLKWKPRYFHSHFSILIFLCHYCLIYSFLDHSEKIVLFFYLVLQSLWLVKKREKPLSISFCKSFNIQQSQNKLANVANREFHYYMRNFCNLIGLEQWYFNLGPVYVEWGTPV